MAHASCGRAVPLPTRSHLTLDLGVREGRSRINGLRKLGPWSASLLYLLASLQTASAASKRLSVLVADDHAVSASAGGRDIILFKERDGQLRKPDRRAERSAGYGRCEFSGDIRLLRPGSYVGGDDVTVI